MSAYVVSSKHINTLVCWGAANDAGFCLTEGAAWTTVKGNEQLVAGVLYTANVESVNDRYKEDACSMSFDYKPVVIFDIEPVTILKACNCLDYQCCEVKNYRNTPAARVIDGIRHAAIRKLPGYDEAPYGI